METTTRRKPGLAGISLFLSVVAHGGLLGLLSWIALVSLSKREAEHHAANRPEIDVGSLELPALQEGVLLSDDKIDPRGEPPVPHGGESEAHIDDGKAGRGGERAGDRATHLADRDEKLSLTTENPSHLHTDQTPRIDTGKVRRSFEDRRSSREPMELTFLSQGTLERLERRTPSLSDPSRGARSDGTLANVAGGRLGGATLGDDSSGELGASRAGGERAAPGQGVLLGVAGADHRESAAVAKARPDVAQEKPSVAAVDKGRPQDDTDADQKVSTIVHSLVHASAAGGQGAQGSGGTTGGGDPGAGGTSGEGSHAAPLGLGGGGPVDIGTRDPRLVAYFRLVHQKLDPLWANAFPRSAIMDLKQGTVILVFTIEANGSAHVSWPPARPSGIDEFDRNCADAIRRASPFPPLPKELGVARLVVRAPFEAKNPIVK